MKNKILRLLSALLVVTAVLALAGCGKEKTEPDANALLQSILQQTAFDTPLEPVDSADLYFSGLPEGTQVTMYRGSGYYADELVLLAAADEKDADALQTSVELHLEEVRTQFLNYIPEELDKIDHALTEQVGRFLFVCLAPDTAVAKNVLDHADDPAYQSPEAAEQPLELPDTREDEPLTLPEETEVPQEQTQEELPAEEPAAEEEGAYPVLTSRDGSYYDYGTNVVRVDNHAFETYGFVEGPAANYADLVNRTAAALAGTTKVYTLPIPTAIGIEFPDDVAAQTTKDGDQKLAIETILGMMSGDVTGVNCYDNMMRHRDEYLYFRTDYHWNGRGAYYAYEAFCQASGKEPVTLDQRTQRDFDGYLGQLYWQSSNEDPVIGGTPDVVETFSPKSASATMEFTDQNGQTMAWQIISDVSGWASSTKYNAFAGGDNPMTVFTNPEVTDGSVLVVVKESYGNALLPYLVDHYSTIYEIDYRYWTGNLAEFAAEKQADELLFANNLSMLGTNLLVGKLSNIIG